MGVLAVDLGGTNIRMGWCSDPRQWTIQESVVWRRSGFPLAVEEFTALLERTMVHWEALHGAVDAVGIAAAAVIDPRTGIVKVGENLGWRNVPLRALLEARLHKPVCLDVDAFCGALAEARLGAGADQEHFLYVVIGTGIGHALVINRRVWHGMHAAANVFGHLKDGFAQIPCYCGGMDCLCQYASGQGLSRLAALQGQPPAIGGIDVARAVRQGEPWAIAVADRMLDALALAISHALNLLDIECVVLGGGVVQPDFPDLASLQQRVEALVYPEIRPILLRRAALEGNAVLTGAALLALDHLHGEQG